MMRPLDRSIPPLAGAQPPPRTRRDITSRAGTTYTAHMGDDRHPNRTACGEPWQGWQAPRTDSYEMIPDIIELPPHDEPRQGDTIRQCQACARIGRGGR